MDDKKWQARRNQITWYESKELADEQDKRFEFLLGHSPAQFPFAADIKNHKIFKPIHGQLTEAPPIYSSFTVSSGHLTQATHQLDSDEIVPKHQVADALVRLRWRLDSLTERLSRLEDGVVVLDRMAATIGVNERGSMVDPSAKGWKILRDLKWLVWPFIIRVTYWAWMVIWRCKSAALSSH